MISLQTGSQVELGKKEIRRVEESSVAWGEK